MKKSRVWIYLLTAGVGSGLHFLYDLLPVAPVAVFAPVNESVWEHLKLLYWPMLLAGVLLARKSDDKRKTWSGVLGAILAMPVWLTGAFYLLKGGFGVELLGVDLALYFLSLLAGFAFVGSIEKRNLPKWALPALVVCVIVYGLLLVYFTTFPPELPIFVSN